MKLARPKTPRVLIDANAKEDNSQNDLILKNFSNFMRQIVENENDKFLTGDTNLIDYVLSKYLKISINDLKNLKKLSIKVSGSYGLLNQFGQRLTELIYLKLNNSFIQSINDLGTNFPNLRILQINDCKLKDLSGIICFEHLEILEAKNNLISDLIELEMCTSIKKLDLENNLIENIKNIYFLSSLDGLIYINLLKNPITNYEQKLKELLPNIKELNSPNKELCDEYYNSINNKFRSVKMSESVSTNNDSKPIYVKINKDRAANNKISGKNNDNDNDIKEEIITNKEKNINLTSANNSNINTINSTYFSGSDANSSTKNKFDFSISFNEFMNNKEANNLKPVITKKKENKEMQLLRQSFTKGGMNNFGFKNNLNNLTHASNHFLRNNMPIAEMKTFKGAQNNKIDMFALNKGGDKFLEEMKNKRFNEKNENI